MTPTHSIFRAIYVIADKIGNTYDYLPGPKTPYPFIYIGELFNTDNSRSDLNGNMTQTIHIYGKLTERKQIMELETQLHDALIKLRKAYGYHVSMTDYTTRLLQDNTDVQPLLHVVMDVTFMYTRKGTN